MPRAPNGGVFRAMDSNFEIIALLLSEAGTNVGTPASSAKERNG